MSRQEKRLHQAAQLQAAQDGQAVESVRLFAFSNSVKGHQSHFAPEDSIVVLKSKSTNPKVHPCSQWLGLSQELYKRDPVLDRSQFVLDTTGLPPQLEFDEDASVVLGGPVLKRATNILSRLNLNRGSLVAAGASAILGTKLLLLGEKPTNSRGDPLFGRLVLVSPKSPESLEALVRHAARHQKAGSKQTWSLTVLLSAAAAPSEIDRWNVFLRSREAQIFFPISSSKVSQQGQSETLFASIASALDVEATGKVITDDSELRLTRVSEPHLYEVAFVLSKFTKQAEQEIEPRDMEDWGLPQVAAAPSTGSAHSVPAASSSVAVAAIGDGKPSRIHPAAAASSVAGAERVPPLCELIHTRRSEGHTFELDAFVVQPEKGVVANAHGAVVVVSRSSEAAAASSSPLVHLGVNTPVRISVAVRRSLKGRMTLELRDGGLRVLSAEEVAASPYLSSTASDAASWLNVSQVCHSVGILIIRGHQCVLVRSLSGEYTGMRFPYQPHDDATQSALECAIEAACIQCDISEDNFAIHPCIAPVMYYPAPSTCVTIYVAVANYPKTSTSMASGEEEDLNDPYDWKPFDAALKSLATRAERAAFTKIVDNIQCAASAGMYTPPHGLPTFGPSSTSLRALIGEVGGASSSDAQDTTYQAPISVVAIHTADTYSTRDELLDALNVPLGSRDADVLLLSGLVGEDSGPSVDSVGSWIASGATGKDKYIVIDATLGSDGVLYFKSYLPDVIEDARRRGVVCGVKVVEVVTSNVGDAVQDTIPGSSVKLASRTINVASLVTGLENADAVLVVCGEASSGRHLVLDFIRAVVSDVNPIPVLSDWQNPDEYLIDFQDDDMNTSKSPATSAFTKYVFRRALPLNPQSFAQLCNDPEAFRALMTQPLLGASLNLVSVGGFVWISTRFGYRGDITLMSSASGDHFNITQGEPWWCVVDEADRPADCDISTWDKQHGDRAQQVHFVFAHSPCSQEEAKSLHDIGASIVAAAMDVSVCAPQEWRSWNRHVDPLPQWEA